MAFLNTTTLSSFFGGRIATKGSHGRRQDESRPRPNRVLHHPAHAVLQHKPSSRPRPNDNAKKPALGSPGHRFYEFSVDDIEAVRLRHCRVDTEELCSYVFYEIASQRMTLAESARQISTCKASKAQDGDLGWWWKNESVPANSDEFGINEELLGAALRARVNRLERVESRDGYHVFMVEEARHVLKTKHERTPSRQNPNSKNRKKPVENIPAPEPMSYAMQTLGCQMNRSDSERMAGELSRLGYHEIADPFRAAVLVLNTCNIRDHAESKVYSYIGLHTERKRKFPQEVTLAVAGCVAQQEGERLLRRVPELDLVFGPQYVNRLGDLLDDKERNQCQVAATEPIHIQEDISKSIRKSTVTAWVNVMYGCGENCTFCTVGNLVRSVEQSRSMEAIRSEVRYLAESGIREVVLLGQNIDAYGRDMFPKKTFAELIEFIHDVDGIDRIRFTTSHPRYISKRLVSTCSTLRKVMPYFHIPPQSGNNDILKAMRRGYSVETFRGVVKRIRDVIPDAGICGDMIVGFPGETESQFQDSLKLLEDIKFDVMNTAAYSPRPKTPAAEFDNQLPESIKSDRLARMNRIVADHALERSRRYVGRVEHVLVEGNDPKNTRDVIGRNETNRTVRFAGSAELKGKIVPVRIVEALSFSLRGEQAGDPY